MKNNIIFPEFYKQRYVQRQVHSFVRRQGRLTKGQQHALDTLWQTMGINYQEQPLDLTVVFGRIAPVTLEIGFGMGTSLVAMAAAHPEQNFIGIEVHLPGIGACLANAQRAGIKNLRIMYHDAVEVLEHIIPNTSLALVQLFFPDPWHKTRHNKRRIIQTPFVELVGHKLTTGGIFHMATDWQPYAKHMLAIMSNARFFRNLSSTRDYIPRPVNRPLTKFEQRGQHLGHSIWDLMFTKTI